MNSLRVFILQNRLRVRTGYEIFPETAQKMDAAIRERMARGEYDKIGDPKRFAATLEEHLQEISRDKHLLIYYRSATIPENANTAPSWIGGLGGLARENYGFVKVELLEGNIGYLELRRFAPPEVSADTAAAAMNFLHNTDGLIIDLRQIRALPSGVAQTLSWVPESEPLRTRRAVEVYW